MDKTILEQCEELILALKGESAKEKNIARKEALEMLVGDIEYRIGSGENYLIQGQTKVVQNSNKSPLKTPIKGG